MRSLSINKISKYFQSGLQPFISATNIFSIVLVIGSCSQSTPNHTTEEIDFSKGLRNEQPVYLSTVGKKVTYIPLETKDGSYLGALSKVVISNNYIATIDKWNKKVLLFNISGKFIKEIGSNGKGPGEFIHVSTIAINDETDVLALFCLELRKLLIINISTGQIDDHLLDFAVTNMTFLSSNLLLMKGPVNMSFEYNDHYFAIFNLKTYKKKYLLEVPDHVKQLLNIEIPLYSFKDTVYYRDVFSDIVYGITKDQNIVEKYKLNIGKNNIPLSAFESYDSFMAATKEFIYLNQMFEIEDLLFIKGTDKAYVSRLVYDKQSKQCYKLPFYEDQQDYLIFNDIDYGPHFWPKGLTNDGNLFCWFYPVRLKKMFKQSIGNNGINTSNNFLSLLNQIKEDDNPIIMIVE